jgi:hypothetical protein
MKAWKVSINGKVVEVLHRKYSTAVLAAQVLRGMGSRKVKVVRAVCPGKLRPLLQEQNRVAGSAKILGGTR